MDTQGSSISQRNLQNYILTTKIWMIIFPGLLAGKSMKEMTGTNDTAPQQISKNGDPASWQSEWIALAQQVEDQEHQLLKAGDRTGKEYPSARLYVLPRPIVYQSANDPCFQDLCKKMQPCFRTAAAIFYPLIEPTSVPFQGKI